jgi:uncharacterized membrane protein
MSTSRVEAFSDGVFAIAITLLVLEIHVPTGHGDDLWHALGQEWPSYVGYVLSFVTIGIIWVNHHAIFHDLARVDRTLLFINLFLLMSVAFIPFTTALMADYLKENQGQDVATAIYSASLLLMAWGFTAINVYLYTHQQLGQGPLSGAERRQRVVRNILGQLAYIAAIGLAFLNAYVSIAVCAFVAVGYIPDRWTRRVPS